MALESASFISGLVSANPPGTDAISQGDDHLRLIKTVLKASLPNADAAINGIHTKATEPSSRSAGQLWFDTTDTLLKMRNAANNAWVVVYPQLGSILATTHARIAGNAVNRSAVYIDSGLAFSHTKTVAASDLYIDINITQETYANFTSDTHTYVYIELRDDTSPPTEASDPITGTNANQQIMGLEDVGQGTGVTWDHLQGWSWMFKVTNANCPTPGAGSQSFKIATKLTNSSDMGSDFLAGRSSVMIWEVAT